MNLLLEDFPFSANNDKLHVLSPIGDLAKAEQEELLNKLSDPLIVKYLNRVVTNFAREIVLTPALSLNSPDAQLMGAYLRGTLSPIYTILEAIREHQEKKLSKGQPK